MIHTPLPVDQLLAGHTSRITLIRQYANEAVQADFDSRWLGVLHRCADWFSSMPLRPDQHAEPGGAFRATIEAAYFAMRLSGAQKFAADQTSERRRKLEPQYLYALFLAASCSRLDEPCRQFQFIRTDDDAEWNPAIHGAFGTWIGDSTYRVVRREAPLQVERMRTALLAREILGADRLSEFDTPVLTDLFGSINPDPKPTGLETLLHKVVRQAIDTTTQFEVKARRAVFSPDTTPAPDAEAMTAAGDTAVPAKAAAAPTGDVTTAPDAGAFAVHAEPPSASPDSPQAATAPADTATSAPTAGGAQGSRSGIRLDGSKSLRSPNAEDRFSEVLAGTSNLMREFFRALAQDVASGKVKVSHVEGKVSISKRMLGNYGMASETLIDNLRKFQLLYKAIGQDILLMDRVGSLIVPSPATGEGAGT